MFSSSFFFGTFFLFILATALAISSAADAAFKGDGKPFGSQGPFIEIDSVESLSTKRFFDEYVTPKRPVVIKGAVRESDAFRLWTDEYLAKRAEPHNDAKLVIETVKKESREQDIDELSLGEFLKVYKERSVYMVNEVPLYLRDEVVLPQPLQCQQAKQVLQETMMWFSSGGTKSVVHTDDYENILCVYDGVKELVLADSNKFPDVIETIIDKPERSYSALDVDQVDYSKYPGIEKLEYAKLNLTAGDCLYIPYKWLHQVRSFDRNLAVNFWFNVESILVGREQAENGKRTAAVSANAPRATSPFHFADECRSNELDKSMTLDKFEYGRLQMAGQTIEDELKSVIYRQFSMGRTTSELWKEWLLENILLQEELDEKVAEKVHSLMNEFFDLLDFDGNGKLSQEEVQDLDQVKAEQILSLLNEMELVSSESPSEPVTKRTPINQKSEL